MSNKPPNIEFWIGHNPKSLVERTIHGVTSYFRGGPTYDKCTKCQDPLLGSWERERGECSKCRWPDAYKRNQQSSFEVPSRYPLVSQYRIKNGTIIKCKTCTLNLLEFEVARGSCSICYSKDLTDHKEAPKKDPSKDDTIEITAEDIELAMSEGPKVIPICTKCNVELTLIEVKDGLCALCRERPDPGTRCERCFSSIRTEQEIKAGKCTFCQHYKPPAYCKKCRAILIEEEIALGECVPDCSDKKGNQWKNKL